jgi:hypothetical protein
MKERVISDCDHRMVDVNCRRCGIYNHEDDPALKTRFYESYLNCSSSKYIKHMRRRECKIIECKNIN